MNLCRMSSGTVVLAGMLSRSRRDIREEATCRVMRKRLSKSLIAIDSGLKGAALDAEARFCRTIAFELKYPYEFM